MSQSQSIFNHIYLNKWNLFWLTSVPMSLIMTYVMIQHDLTTGDGVSEMIGFSVRWAVPLIYIVTAASAVNILFPNTFTKWWFRNRKYIGMTFAVAMGWQGTFIYIMSTFYRDYYFEDVYLLRNEIEGSIGYIFLAAMVVTSFKFGSKYVNASQWKIIHKSGVYFLWAYAYTVYWWALYYYEDQVLFEHIFYWLGFTAFALRIFAWGKKRSRNSSKPNLFLSMTGYSLIVFGFIVACTGLTWRESATNILLSPKWSADLELWLPFWPFEPFFCFFIMGLGVMILTPQEKQKSLSANPI